jgi:hypothetical protein
VSVSEDLINQARRYVTKLYYGEFDTKEEAIEAFAADCECDIGDAFLAFNAAEILMKNASVKLAAEKLSVRKFVMYHGFGKPAQNAKIFDMCKKNMKKDPKCAGFMKKFEQAKDRYLEDRAGGKDYNDSMLNKVLKACQKHCLPEKK